MTEVGVLSVKPCPFCGEREALNVYDETDGADRAWVACGRCDSCGPSEKTVEKAVAAWNERANERLN